MGLEVELGPVAGLVRPRPPQDLHDLASEAPELGRVRVGQVELLFALALLDLLALLEAEVVGPALEHGEAERPAEVGGQEREVLARQLVLQGLGGRGDDARDPREHAGDEVGERLPRAGARLHHQVLLALDGAGDGMGHLQLTGPVLSTARQRGRDLRQRFGDVVEVTSWRVAIPGR